MRLSLGQKLIIVFGVALVILVATGVVASRTTRELVAVVDHVASEHAIAALSASGTTPTADPLAVRAAVQQEAALARASARRAVFVVRFGLVLALALAPLAFLILRHDFLIRRKAERALRDSEARFRAAADGSLDAFYVLRAVRDTTGKVSDFEFADLNARAEALLGRPRGALIGKHLCELIPANRTSGQFAKYLRVMEQQELLEEEVEVTSPDLPAAWIHQQVVPLSDGVAISSRDITARKEHEDALRSLTMVDELTELYNRRGFLTSAGQQLRLAKRGHRELLLLFLDMDDFKDINDNFGHAEGDRALVRASQILRKTFRDSDVLARLGGDEFVVLAADPGAGATDTIINRLRSELMERNALESRPYQLSFSVGVARFDPNAPASIEELLATADAMLYEQKRQRRQPELVAR